MLITSVLGSLSSFLSVVDGELCWQMFYEKIQKSMRNALTGADVKRVVTMPVTLKSAGMYPGVGVFCGPC